MHSRVLGALVSTCLVVGCGSGSSSDGGSTTASATSVGTTAPATSGGTTTPARPPSGTGALQGVDDLTLYLNLGDSIASGEGVPAQLAYRDLLFQNDVLYPGYAQRHLSAQHPGVRLIDEAIPGLTSSEVVSRAQQQVGTWPDPAPGADTLVTISMGGNDLLRDVFNPTAATAHMLTAGYAQQKAAALGQNWRTLLQLLKSKFERPAQGARLVVVGLTLYDLTDGTGTLPSTLIGFGCTEMRTVIQVAGGWVPTQNLEVINDATRGALRAEGASVADLYTLFSGHGIVSGDPYLDPRDCIHPDEAGHHAIRREVWRILTGSP